MLTSTSAQQYERQLSLPEIGYEGQEKLLQSSVLILGAGGLGSPAALYLAAAGIGTIGICDHDIVSLSNLQRQLLYGTADLGRQKAESARDRLAMLNPEVTVSRELLLIKVENDASTRNDILTAVDAYEAKIVDYSKESIVVQLVGESRKIDDFINLMRDYVILEIGRTGVVALERGASTIRQVTHF